NLWLPALAGRLAMAGRFIPSGFGKGTNLSKITADFVELGIPPPGLDAAGSATHRRLCGAPRLGGRAAPVAGAAPPARVAVAILTAKLHDVHTVGDFFYMPEPAYIVIFLWLIFGGAGEVSTDHWIAKKTTARPA